MQNATMNKDTLLFHLNAIVRQITCMNQDGYKNLFKDGEINAKFRRFEFGDPSYVDTTITMKRIKIED